MSSWYLLGQNVTMLNRACVEELRGLYQWNEKLMEARDLIFEIRYEMDDQFEDNLENYFVLYSKFCLAHEMYKTVV
jgi:hypothetical protein